MQKTTDEYLRSPCYGILPMRNRHGKAWAWRVVIDRCGRTIYRGFSFKRYGGVHAALLAAQAYRGKALQMYPPLTKRQRCIQLRIDNSSGIAGIRRVQRSESQIFWEARTVAQGRFFSKSFNVKLYGEEGAKQKAIEARQQQLAQIDNTYDLRSQEARELYANLGEPPKDDNAAIV